MIGFSTLFLYKVLRKFWRNSYNSNKIWNCSHCKNCMQIPTTGKYILCKWRKCLKITLGKMGSRFIIWTQHRRDERIIFFIQSSIRNYFSNTLRWFVNKFYTYLIYLEYITTPVSASDFKYIYVYRGIIYQYQNNNGN